jgi:sensor domain CHASE-containing protein
MRKIVLIVIACVWVVGLFFIDRWEMDGWNSEREYELTATARLCQVRLENAIASRFNAIEALAALVVLHPETKRSEFEQFTSRLIQLNPPIRALQYADAQTRVTYVYPAKGNEITISTPMTLLTDSRRSPFVEKAIEQKRAVLQ